MISHNKELMFSGRALHPGDIPWTAFLSYPNINAPLSSLDLQPVSASHSGKPRRAVLLQGRSRCHWLPIPTSKWAMGWAHKYWHWWDQPWPACAKGTLFLATDLIWTHRVTLKLQLRRHLRHPQYALSTLFLNMCKKSHYFTSPEKESTVAFGICLHTSSTLFSALWWWWYLLLLLRCTRLCNCLAFWFNQLGEKTCSKFY